MSEPLPPTPSLQMFPAGAVLIPQGGKLGTLFVLREGQIEIERDGAHIRTIGQRGSILGEMSVLLDIPHSATVRAVTPVEVYVIPNALAVMEQRPLWTLQLARLLAQRLYATTASLVESQHRLDGKDDLVSSEEILDMLGDPQT